MVPRIALRLTLALALALLAGGAAAEQATKGKSEKGKSEKLKSEKEKISYALGMGFAHQLRTQSIEVDPEVLVRALKDALSRGKTLLTEEEARAIVAGLQKELKAKQTALQSEKVRVRKELGEKSQQDGEAFLAKNKTREGVVTLASGLQYKILKKGDGRRPALDDTVICHYRGTLVDGTEFDSSYKRNQPATLPVKKLIKGWSEGLQLMPVGSTWQFVIPSTLAYGDRGVGRHVGPRATLVFDVELISIKDRTAAATTERKEPASPTGSVSPGQAVAAVPAPAAAARIAVSFKMDPRLATGNYGGERWVSPPTYTRVGEGKTCTVEARAQGLDANGRSVPVSPTWTSADPDMVTVTPSEGGDVKILVQRAGESNVSVTAGAVSTELTIKAAYPNNVLQVDISRK